MVSLAAPNRGRLSQVSTQGPAGDPGRVRYASTRRRHCVIMTEPEPFGARTGNRRVAGLVGGLAWSGRPGVPSLARLRKQLPQASVSAGQIACRVNRSVGVALRNYALRGSTEPVCGWLAGLVQACIAVLRWVLNGPERAGTETTIGHARLASGRRGRALRPWATGCRSRISGRLVAAYGLGVHLEVEFSRVVVNGREESNEECQDSEHQE